MSGLCVSLALPHYRTQGWLLSFRQYLAKFCVSHMGLRALVFTWSHPALGPGHSGPWLPFTPPSPFQMPRGLGSRNVFHSLHHVFIALGLGEEAGLGLCFGALFYVSMLWLQFCFYELSAFNKDNQTWDLGSYSFFGWYRSLPFHLAFPSRLFLCRAALETSSWLPPGCSSASGPLIIL